MYLLNVVQMPMTNGRFFLGDEGGVVFIGGVAMNSNGVTKFDNISARTTYQ